jgi:multidrug resistance efflux pump
VSASRHGAQLGDYATVGQKLISLVDTDSFWIDGYFEETSLGRTRDGDPATVKLMDYSQLVRGHVCGVARGIKIPNAQPDSAGLASVNPIFTWVRLAQRVPVRIHIDRVGPTTAYISSVGLPLARWAGQLPLPSKLAVGCC